MADGSGITPGTLLSFTSIIVQEYSSLHVLEAETPKHELVKRFFQLTRENVLLLSICNFAGVPSFGEVT